MEIMMVLLTFAAGFLSIYFVKYFERYNEIKTANNNDGKDTKNSKAQFSDYKLNKIIETEISYENIGTEHRTINNLNNNGHVKRKMTISREWKKSFNFSETQNLSSDNSGRVSFQFIELGLKLSNAIESKYEFQNMETKTYSEEIELDILPQSKIVLEIDWKIIWQNGLIELIDDKNNILYYSYKIAKGLTFDQTQRNVS